MNLAQSRRGADIRRCGDRASLMKDRLNLHHRHRSGPAARESFWFFSNPQRTQRVQAGFLGADLAFPEARVLAATYYTAKQEGLKRLDELEKEVKQLRMQNKELSAINQALRGLESENNRLSSALGYREARSSSSCRRGSSPGILDVVPEGHHRSRLGGS